MLDGTVEIITGKERRRRWSTEEKLRIVAEAQEPGAPVTDVAARHEVYPRHCHINIGRAAWNQSDAMSRRS